MSWIKKFIDGRGQSPNSKAQLEIARTMREAARLAALQAESVARGQEAANPQPSPPPATPTPPPPRTVAPPVANDADFFQRMEQYEAWRLRVYEAEAQRRRSMAEEIRAALEAEIDAGLEAEDPVESALVSQILPILAQKFLNGTPTAQGGAGGANAPPVFSPEYQAGLDAQKPQDAPTGPEDFTVEQARAIVANLEREKPAILKKVRAGKFSKSEVFSYLALQGVPAERAEVLYRVAMEPRNHTEQEGEE